MQEARKIKKTKDSKGFFLVQGIIFSGLEGIALQLFDIIYSSVVIKKEERIF